jgi:hypothetical protein
MARGESQKESEDDAQQPHTCSCDLEFWIWGSEYLHREEGFSFGKNGRDVCVYIEDGWDKAVECLMGVDTSNTTFARRDILTILRKGHEIWIRFHKSKKYVYI